MIRHPLTCIQSRPPSPIQHGTVKEISSMSFVASLDFKNKQEERLDYADVVHAVRDDRYCWIDCAGDDVDQVGTVLKSLGIEDDVIERVTADDKHAHFGISQTCLYFGFVETEIVDGDFQRVPVQIIINDRFMMSIHRESAEFLRNMENTYREDFYTSAKSPGFLVFELADHLTISYRITLSTVADQIKLIQTQLLGDPDDRIFSEVAKLIRDLLDYRKTVISAREILHELATRRSRFVSETTQPFLEKKATLLERLSADAATEREVLSETLNLYMGIVSHRTNQVVTRLTVMSFIFLPLGFLVGLYGMNFEYMPELKGQYSYYLFLTIVVTLVVSIVLWMRRMKWL